MAVRWTFDHARKFAEIVLTGETGEEEAARFFDALEAANAQPYRKLVDAREAVPKIDEGILKLVTARIAAFSVPGRSPRIRRSNSPRLSAGREARRLSHSLRAAFER